MHVKFASIMKGNLEMNDEIMLSILVPTYGHEKYIVQALDSIRMQKTKYKYEVLVGEDASPDNTREILKKYDKKYPGEFQMFYREKNMWSQKIRNGRELLLRARGKYVITLEGDDYWTAADKIEKQIDFLESHPEYIAVAHNCVVVNGNGEETGEDYCECKHENYTLRDYFYNILPGQLATFMYRNYERKRYFDTSIFEKGLTPGDKLVAFALVTNGKVYCIQEKMSAYRHVTNGGHSFSANFYYDVEKDLHWHEELLKFAYQNRNEDGIKCAEILYFDVLIRALTKKVYNMGQVWGKYRKLNHKCLIPFGFLYRRVVLKLKRR